MTMTARIAFAALGLTLAAALTACGTASHPATAACKTALAKQISYYQAHPAAKPGSELAACKGLSSATLNRLAGGVMSSALATAAAPSSPVPGMTAADIARQAGATGVQAQPLPRGTAESSEALAIWKGQNVTVSTFATAADRARWEAADPAMTVTNGDAAGTLYAITAVS